MLQFGRPLPILAVDYHMPVPTSAIQAFPPSYALPRGTTDGERITGVCIKQEFGVGQLVGEEGLSGIPPDSPYRLYVQQVRLPSGEEALEMAMQPPKAWSEAGHEGGVEWLSAIDAVPSAR